MEVKKQSKLYFRGVDILNVNFIALSPKKDSPEIEINCSPKVFLPSDSPKEFKIIIDVEIGSKDYFELTLRAVGNFELSDDIDDDLKATFINSNATAMMFPYVRSFVSTLTSNLGKTIDHITIPTQFFRGDLDVIDELS